MAQLITVRLNKSDHQPLGFRLQGGKDFGTPLVVQKVNGGSAAERAGLQAGDALIRVNTSDVFTLRHQEAQDAIRAAGPVLELTVQRGGGTWRPTVTPTGSLPRPGSRPLGSTPTPVTNTSLKATSQPSRAFGSGHNSVAKPFGYMNGNEPVKSIVNKQYNTPVNIYSDQTIAETLSAQTEVLAGGVLGVNFKKNEKNYDAEKSAVFKVLQEEQNDPEPEVGSPVAAPPVSGLRHVQAPVTRPDAPINNTGGLPPGQNICEECERLITGVFVRIKDKNLHVECFKCSTCGTSLKNQGYFNINGKLYCDIHAKLVARQNPPAANLEPVTVSPGSRIPPNSYSTPLPPLSTNNYTNGSSSLFSPSSNLSGPKPFGSSIGSAYSPSLSPRSGPLSPARPVAAPAPTLTPAPLPFAPTQNLKTIVWPPQSCPEDNPPKLPPEDVTNMKKNIVKDLRQNIEIGQNLNVNVDAITRGNIQQRTIEEYKSMSQQSLELNSSIASASTVTSGERGSFVDNRQSQMVQASSCMRTSESASSQNQLLIISPSMNVAPKGREQNIHQEAIESKSLTQQKMVSTVENIYHQTTNIDKTQNTHIALINNKGLPGSVTFSLDNKATNIGNQAIRTFEIAKNISNDQKEGCSLSANHMDKSITSPLNQSAILNNTENDQKSSTNTNETTTKTQAIQKTSERNMFSQRPRGITPIPPINTYHPPDKTEVPIPMPAETEPYLPPDFKIQIEPKIVQEKCSSPMIEALTTAPQRPFTPVKTPTIERGSLREALTIAPDRSFSPLPLNVANRVNDYNSNDNVQSTSEIIRPIATQTISNVSNNAHYEFSNMQNISTLQSSTEVSAFKPVSKQLSTYNNQFEDMSNIAIEQTSNKRHCEKQEASMREFTSKQHSTVSSNMKNENISSVKSAQSYFEQLDHKESFTAAAIRSTTGLYKADNIPIYQKNIEMLPSQRGITPELCNAPAVFQRPVTPKSDPPGMKEKNQEPNPTNVGSVSPPVKSPLSKNIRPNEDMEQTIQQFHKDNPISMTFQPVTDEILMRASPARSRASTPSMINKPAPIIPYYQKNLLVVEHSAPECHTYVPSSPETSRSPTPKLRSHSPAPGPPPNPLKAHAPRIKETTPGRSMSHTLLTQATSNLRKEHEMETKKLDLVSDNYWNKDQSSSSVAATLPDTAHTNKTNFKNSALQDFTFSQKNERQINTKSAAECNISVHNIRKTIEESQSANFVISNESRAIPTKTDFSPPVMNFTPPHDLPTNYTTENVISTNNINIEKYQTTPSITGANKGPVCDPTPSTGSSIGASPRGKTFGVSSAPKRGKGVLNKAALPGSRVPLCASCNGNIRGPFITALGRIWCPDHFICVNATCRRPLQDIGFVEENGQLYCEFCFEQYIAPACDKCHAKIKGDCLNAIGKHFHPECFNCVYCGKLFGNNPFFLEDGLPYCEADWNELFTTKCFACGFPVEAGDRWVEALNNNYHSQCFNCTVCKKNLEGQSFFAKGGRPFCKVHAR